VRSFGRKGRGDEAASAPAPPQGVPISSRIPAEIAKRIRLVIFDVDGVLTDAGVYMGLDAEGSLLELKRFNIQDGLGLRLLLDRGLEVALVSGRVSPATEARAREIGIRECHQEPGAQKLPVVVEMMERLGVSWDEVAMMGDDLPDMAVLERVGLPVAVANAISEVRRMALWTSRREGGHGAVREFCKVLLEARGEWEATVEGYVSERRKEHR